MYKELMSLKYEKAGNDVDYKIVLKKDKEELDVFFLGSNSKADWKNNFNFPVKVYKKQESCILAHRGFVKAFKSANDEIFDKIEEMLLKSKVDISKTKVCFIGHSFGGAMAVLSAEDFWFRFRVKPNVYTYGSPRVLFGNKSKNYVRSCINEIVQFSHRNDIVTYVPPMYKHVEEMKIGKFYLKGLFNPQKYHLIYDDLDKCL